MEPNTGYYAKMIEDSINPWTRVRLTTMEVCFPRFILAEFNTHRMFSRNSASSRAIPVAKQIERIKRYPFVPEKFGMNKPGMQADTYAEGDDLQYALKTWNSAMWQALVHAEALLERGIHKQTVNRLLEPYAWHTVIVTATDWDNFFKLRISPEAQPEINTIAMMMRDCMFLSIPQEHHIHLPFVNKAERNNYTYLDGLMMISAARCARVSYLTHDGEHPDPEVDMALANRLKKSGHWSPFEHVANASISNTYFANFKSWKQYRMEIENELD